MGDRLAFIESLKVWVEITKMHAIHLANNRSLM